jgi:hypothetical protein
LPKKAPTRAVPPGPPRTQPVVHSRANPDPGPPTPHPVINAGISRADIRDTLTRLQARDAARRATPGRPAGSTYLPCGLRVLMLLDAISFPLRSWRARHRGFRVGVRALLAGLRGELCASTKATQLLATALGGGEHCLWPGRTDPPPSVRAKHEPLRFEPRSRAPLLASASRRQSCAYHCRQCGPVAPYADLGRRASASRQVSVQRQTSLRPIAPSAVCPSRFVDQRGKSAGSLRRSRGSFRPGSMPRTARDGPVSGIALVLCLGRNCDVAVFAPSSTITRVPTVTRL